MRSFVQWGERSAQCLATSMQTPMGVIVPMVELQQKDRYTDEPISTKYYDERQKVRHLHLFQNQCPFPLTNKPEMAE